MSLVTCAALPVRAPVQAPLRLSVRNTTTADAAAVALVYNEGLSMASGLATPQPDVLDSPLTSDMTANWIAMHQNMSRPLWLAEVDGSPVAWLSFYGFSERPGCAGAVELGIQVRESWRGRGVGRQLLSRAIAASPGLGFDRLIACIRNDNQASLALFRSHDFEPWGRYPGVLRGLAGRKDLLIFGREVQSERPWYAGNV